MEKEIQYYSTEVITEHGYIMPPSLYSTPKHKKTLIGETLDNIYEQFYKLNNSLRYCNGLYYKFVDSADEADYLKWQKNLSKEKSFNLFYGNGVVD